MAIRVAVDTTDEDTINDLLSQGLVPVVSGESFGPQPDLPPAHANLLAWLAGEVTVGGTHTDRAVAIADRIAGHNATQGTADSAPPYCVSDDGFGGIGTVQHNRFADGTHWEWLDWDWLGSELAIPSGGPAKAVSFAVTFAMMGTAPAFDTDIGLGSSVATSQFGLYGLPANDGNLYVYELADGGGGGVTYPYADPAFDRHKMVVTLAGGSSGTFSVKVYIDGVLLGTHAFSATSAATIDIVKIGVEVLGAGSFHFSGGYKWAPATRCVWNKELTADEVAAYDAWSDRQCANTRAHPRCNPTAYKLICDGDSRTHGTSSYVPYPALLATYLGVSVDNKGTSGATYGDYVTDPGARPLAATFASQCLPEFDPFKQNVVICFAGYNDATAAGVGTCAPGLSCQAYWSTVPKDAFRIILTDPQEVRVGGSVLTMNNWIRTKAIAQGYGDAVGDLAGDSRVTSTAALACADVSPDDLHYTTLGHQFIAEDVRRTLERVGFVNPLVFSPIASTAPGYLCSWGDTVDNGVVSNAYLCLSDESGTNHHAAAYDDSARRPAVASSHGKNVARFADTNALTLDPITLHTTGTMLLVVDPNDAAPGAMALFVDGTTHVVKFPAGVPTVVWDGVTLAEGSALTGLSVVAIEWTPTTLAISVNGGSKVTASLSSPTAPSFATIGSATTSAGFVGDFARGDVIDGALTSDQLSSNVSRLRAIYGI